MTSKQGGSPRPQLGPTPEETQAQIDALRAELANVDAAVEPERYRRLTGALGGHVKAFKRFGQAQPDPTTAASYLEARLQAVGHVSAAQRLRLELEAEQAAAARQAFAEGRAAEGRALSESARKLARHIDREQPESEPEPELPAVDVDDPAAVRALMRRVWGPKAPLTPDSDDSEAPPVSEPISEDDTDDAAPEHRPRKGAPSLVVELGKYQGRKRLRAELNAEAHAAPEPKRQSNAFDGDGNSLAWAFLAVDPTLSRTTVNSWANMLVSNSPSVVTVGRMSNSDPSQRAALLAAFVGAESEHERRVAVKNIEATFGIA